MKCHHADSGSSDCAGEAVVLASESYGILRQDLPLCGGCAPSYARQAAQYAAERLARGFYVGDGSFEMTLRPLQGDR